MMSPGVTLKQWVTGTWRTESLKITITRSGEPRHKAALTLKTYCYFCHFFYEAHCALNFLSYWKSNINELLHAKDIAISTLLPCTFQQKDKYES